PATTTLMRGAGILISFFFTRPQAAADSRKRPAIIRQRLLMIGVIYVVEFFFDIRSPGPKFLYGIHPIASVRLNIAIRTTIIQFGGDICQLQGFFTKRPVEQVIGIVIDAAGPRAKIAKQKTALVLGFFQVFIDLLDDPRIVG